MSGSRRRELAVHSLGWLSILLVGGLSLFAFVKQPSEIWEEVGALGHQDLGGGRAFALGGAQPRSAAWSRRRRLSCFPVRHHLEFCAGHVKTHGSLKTNLTADHLDFLPPPTLNPTPRQPVAMVPFLTAYPLLYGLPVSLIGCPSRTYGRVTSYAIIHIGRHPQVHYLLCIYRVVQRRETTKKTHRLRLHMYPLVHAMRGMVELENALENPHRVRLINSH